MKAAEPRKTSKHGSVLSPFRYPGGKSWLRPVLRRWLKPGVDHLIEAFAGGGNVTIMAISENLAKRATMVELDPDVASVWQAMLNGQSGWMCNQITSFKLTRRAVKAELEHVPSNVRQRAWLTLLRNRVSHGGILAPGSGLLKRGEDDNGLKSRWYPETLSKRIKAINLLKKRISFLQEDGLVWLENHLKPGIGSVAFFIDPPYASAGRRLYRYGELEHSKLFEVASKLHGRVLMTYDDMPEVRSLAAQFGFSVHPVDMRNRQHKTKTELLIAKDFSWLE